MNGHGVATLYNTDSCIYERISVNRQIGNFNNSKRFYTSGIFEDNFFDALERHRLEYGIYTDDIINKFNLGFYDEFMNSKSDDVSYKVPTINQSIDATSIYVVEADETYPIDFLTIDKCDFETLVKRLFNKDKYDKHFNVQISPTFHESSFKIMSERKTALKGKYYDTI
jgi:hypothetical protein